jgi:hypothetical protein
MTTVGTLVGVILIALGWQYLLNRWLVRWAGRKLVAEEIAQAIEAYDGPLTDGPRTTLARVARQHGEAGHG